MLCGGAARRGKRGEMVLQAWSVADVREAEAIAMAALPDGALMQRAAKGLAAVARARLRADRHGPGRRRVVGLVGSGGNGGDTLYALARLARKSSADSVIAVLVSDRGVHPGGLKAARKHGVRILDPAVGDGGDRAAATAAVGQADLLLDGLTGIGGRAGWAPGSAALIEELLDAVPPDCYVLAVDLPSGADPAGEVVASPGVWADETVTFGVPKPVHLLGTADRCGALTVVDIGLAMTTPPTAERLEHDDVARLWPAPEPTDDKYARGVLGIVAGGQGYTGAAILAVTAAVCAGAGMVRYVGPHEPTWLVRMAVPEAVLGMPGEGQRVQAWLVGPGLDPEDDSADGQAQIAHAREALESGLPCVVDAGGLELLDGPRAGAGARTLLTPHAGELARLLTRLEGAAVQRGDVEADPVGHARRAAAALHATVLLKGHTTYVVAPPASGLAVRALADAPAWVGTAGAGDVLAGLAGTLLAAGLDPRNAGSLAALVHGLAADRANPGGPVRALDVALAMGPTVAQLLRR